MLLFQIIVTIFVIFALSRIFLQWRNENIGVKAVLFWAFLWMAVLTALFWPGFLVILSEKLGISRGVDVFVYFGLIILFYLVYRINIRLEEQAHEITKIVRETALKKFFNK